MYKLKCECSCLTLNLWGSCEQSQDVLVGVVMRRMGLCLVSASPHPADHDRNRQLVRSPEGGEMFGILTRIYTHMKNNRKREIKYS